MIKVNYTHLNNHIQSQKSDTLFQQKILRKLLLHINLGTRQVIDQTGLIKVY